MTNEPVIRDGSPITIHCPECHHLGTHLGTCSWSQMRCGRVWTFRAIAVDITEPYDGPIPRGKDDIGI